MGRGRVGWGGGLLAGHSALLWWGVSTEAGGLLAHPCTTLAARLPMGRSRPASSRVWLSSALQRLGLTRLLLSCFACCRTCEQVGVQGTLCMPRCGRPAPAAALNAISRYPGCL